MEQQNKPTIGVPEPELIYYQQRIYQIFTDRIDASRSLKTSVSGIQVSDSVSDPYNADQSEMTGGMLYSINGRIFDLSNNFLEPLNENEDHVFSYLGSDSTSDYPARSMMDSYHTEQSPSGQYIRSRKVNPTNGFSSHFSRDSLSCPLGSTDPFSYPSAGLFRHLNRYPSTVDSWMDQMYN